MKFSIVLSALIVLMLSAGINKAEASPWRGGRGYCHPVVRIFTPPVVFGGYAPRYCHPRYYAPRCYSGCRHGYYR